MVGLDKLLDSVRAKRKLPKRLLALDPGETIGWSIWIDGELSLEGQTKIGDNVDKVITDLVELAEPTEIVIEDYRVYSHKSDVHIGIELITPKLIGKVELLCYQKNIPLAYQMASQAKGFVTDEKLKAWGLYIKGHRHSRDSIRHAIYYFLFKK